MKKMLLLLLLIPSIVLADDTNCQVVDINNCVLNNKDTAPNLEILCFECIKDKKKIYTQADNEINASKVTGGKNCQNVMMDSCSPSNSNVVENSNIKCYSCVIDDVTKYTQALDENSAYAIIDGFSNIILPSEELMNVSPLPPIDDGVFNPGEIDDSETTENITSESKDNNNYSNNNILKFVIGFVIVGVVLFIALYFSNKKSNK